mmetsp:Transcript_28846/g.68805  ORF Transcript_28846/g.68805 Transcript_28846/m.68805 type:complete len:320 (-) Transcript_28846:94-1053(-)
MQHVGQGAARTSMRRRRRSGEGDVGVVAGLEEELGVEGREVLLPRRLARTRRVQPVLVAPLELLEGSREVSHCLRVRAQPLCHPGLERDALLLRDTGSHLNDHLGKIVPVLLLHLSNGDAAMVDAEEHEGSDPHELFVHRRLERRVIHNGAGHPARAKPRRHLLGPLARGGSEALGVDGGDAVGGLLAELRHCHVHQHLGGGVEDTLRPEEVLDEAVLPVEDQVLSPLGRAFSDDAFESIVARAHVDRPRPVRGHLLAALDQRVVEACVLAKLLQRQPDPPPADDGGCAIAASSTEADDSRWAVHCRPARSKGCEGRCR